MARALDLTARVNKWNMLPENTSKKRLDDKTRHVWNGKKEGGEKKLRKMLTNCIWRLLIYQTQHLLHAGNVAAAAVYIPVQLQCVTYARMPRRRREQRERERRVCKKIIATRAYQQSTDDGSCKHV